MRIYGETCYGCNTKVTPQMHALVSTQSLGMVHSSLQDGGSGLRLNDGLFIKPYPVGWGLTIWLWLGPPWFNFWFSFTLAHSKISHEYFSLFIQVMYLIFMFLLWCKDWVGSLYANRFLCISVLRVASGPRVTLAGRKSALNPWWFFLLTF